MPDRVLFSYHDTTLFATDPLTLRDGNWLNDSIISFYFEYLANEVLRGDSSVLFLKPAIVQLLRLQKDPLSLRSALPPALNATKYLFAPINNGDDVYVPGGSGSHWSLLLYTPRPPQFHYYDSAANSNYQVALAVKEKLQSYLGLPVTPIITHSCPQQENSSDCGVFVILFADLLARRYADLRLPGGPANPLAPMPAGYSMLASRDSDIIHRVLSPFAVHEPGQEAAAAAYSVCRPGMFADPKIEKVFYWIDYGDLCNPNKARKILRDLIKKLKK